MFNKKRIIVEFKPRVPPVFHGGFYVSGYKLNKVVFTKQNIMKNAQK